MINRNIIKKISSILYYGKLSNGGIRRGALDSIIPCGFISRLYLSNCLFVLAFNLYPVPSTDRGAEGRDPVTEVFVLWSEINWSTDSQNVLLAFGFVITGVTDGRKPDNSSCELYWAKAFSSLSFNDVLGG